VIYNNGGWKAPRVGAIAMHPDGAASRAADIDTGFTPEPDYAGIAAAAGGACALRISRPNEIEPALNTALTAVRNEGRCAVIDARVIER
jgi:acetolactate synthase-1/2/3 large subunit